jgi:DnaJ-class molecular chaperone
MEIREEDLTVISCKQCNGRGIVWQDVPGMPRGTRVEADCPDCEGRGVRLTPTGALLAEFIRRVANLRSI